MIEFNIIYQKTERKLKLRFYLFLFWNLLLWLRNKAQILSLCSPIAFMYYLIFIQLNHVLENQNNEFQLLNQLFSIIHSRVMVPEMVKNHYF